MTGQPLSGEATGIYKGFTRSHLEWAFDVRFSEEGVVVPYYGVGGEPYREKLFSAEGRPLRWTGEAGRPQIPYGLETLSKESRLVFVTEGEGCAWALRAEFRDTPVLGLPGASSWKPEWAQLIKGFPLVYLSIDNDEAGRKLVDAVWPAVPHARRIVLPSGADTRDVLQLLGGREAFDRLIEDANQMADLRAYFDVLANDSREEQRSHAA